jgi:DctM-like transporters.
VLEQAVLSLIRPLSLISASFFGFSIAALVNFANVIGRYLFSAPIIWAAGLDLIHFAIIVTVNLNIGMCTPPLDLNILARTPYPAYPCATSFAALCFCRD